MKYLQTKTKRYSWRYSKHWNTEKFELTDLPSSYLGATFYNHGLHLTMREAKSLHSFLTKVLESAND